MTTSLARARSLIELRRYQEALESVRRSDGWSTDSPSLCVAAQAELGLGHLAEARRLAEAAARLAPTSEWPVRLASIASMRQTDFDTARHYADHAVRLAPNEWRAHMQLAQVDASAKTVDARTWQAARAAVRLAPNEAQTHLTLGNVALADRSLEVAEQAYREALRLHPDNAVARNNLSVIDMRRHRFGRAFRGFRDAARIDPTSDLAVGNMVSAAVAPFMLLACGLTIMGLLSNGAISAPTDRHSRVIPASYGLAGLVLAVGVSVTFRLRVGRALVPLLRRAVQRDRLVLVWLLTLGAAVALLLGAVLDALLAAVPTGSGWLLGSQLCALASVLLGLLRVGRQRQARRGRSR